MKRFYSRGKLLLSGEYLVLSGAKALGVPLTSGQDLQLKAIAGKYLKWNSKEKGTSWFQASFDPGSYRVREASDARIASHLSRILVAADRLKEHADSGQVTEVITNLEFQREYGWGSSATLLVNIARWFGIDPLDLHFKTSPGSGYDIVLAMADGPVIYQLQDAKPVYHRVDVSDEIKTCLYFVFLGQKQDTQRSIVEYHKKKAGKDDIEIISSITERMTGISDIDEFQELIREHEGILSRILGKPGIQDAIFRDFKGSLKSMGAWGGDFILACTGAGADYVRSYFGSRGYPVVYPFQKIVYYG